jgi:glycosyltransferase involved in cell wall biosynthesis
MMFFNKDSKFLFLHFSPETRQLEGNELPAYFSRYYKNVYSYFKKDNREFSLQYERENYFKNVDIEHLRSISYDYIICKSSAFQTYGKNFRSPATKVINLIPLGLPGNLEGVDAYFTDGQLIKPPTPEMQEIFSSYYPYQDRPQQIVCVGSLGTDKNQIEFLNLISPEDFKSHEFVFIGPVRNQHYVDTIKTILERKSLSYRFLGDVPREVVAEEIRKSKFSFLTTDPRPFQPFDPSPRVIFESLRGGTPCIISDLVLTHKSAYAYCFQYKNHNPHSFAEMIEKIKDASNHNLSKQAFEFAQGAYSMEEGCRVAHEDIVRMLSA